MMKTLTTLKYFILVMKAPKTAYGGLVGKLKHFRKACKMRSEVRKKVRGEGW